MKQNPNKISWICRNKKSINSKILKTTTMIGKEHYYLKLGENLPLADFSTKETRIMKNLIWKKGALEFQM